MRQGQGKRSRGRGQGRKNVPLRAQVFDSNGPDVRIRGTAQQVHEKYMALYRDAAASGERIMSENYLQHADHYYRILAAANAEAEARRNPQHPLQPQPQPPGVQPEPAEAAEPAADAGDAAEAGKSNGRGRDGDGAAPEPSDPGSGPQPDIVLAEPQSAPPAEANASEDAAEAKAPVNGSGGRRGPRGGRGGQRRGRAAASETPSSDDGTDAEPAT